MKKMKEAWDDIYENSAMSDQTLRGNAARFRKDNSLLILLKVKDGNDVETKAIHIRAIELVRSQENINKEEGEETRLMRLRKFCILQKHLQRNIVKGESV